MDIGSILGTSPAVPQAPAVAMPAAAQPTPNEIPSAASLLTPSAAAPASPAVPQVTHRSFGDSIGTRKAIYDSVLNAARAFAPATNNQYTLGLQNVDYDGRDNFTKAEQKKAILSGATLGRSLRGDWVLTDPAGAEVSRKRALLARVPHMTERGTFIVNGSEYSLANQLRLRPGIYTRQQENGEIEAHVNVKSGRAHKLFLDPATGIFRIKIGQARIPLLPLLKTMGVTDKQIRENWGDLAAVNQQKSDPQALKKLYERVRSTGTETDPEAQSKSVAEAFQQMELDPDVTKRTLGQAFTRVGPDSILATTKKLLAVSRGEQEPDDRDSMAYQSLMGPEDLFAERITKAKNIARNLLWKSTARRGIDHIPAGVLTNALQSTLTMSGLGQALEEINTAEILDHQSRVTRRGEGGIQDASAIPMASRSVNPSQLGLIDYLRTPESLSAGIDVRLARNAMKGSDGRLYTKVINAKSGLTETRSANDIADGTLAFSGELQSGKLYVNVLQNGKIRTVPRESVDYELPDTESSFSPLGNMIPFKSMVKGQRSVMGSRFLTQALPLENAEAPYVQSGIPGQVDRSFEQEYGTHMGALRSPQGGVVTKVTPDAVEVRYEDGTKETHELYNNQPLNRKTFLHQSPTVRPGQTFKKGDLLARSNYTDHEGTTALGMNARVAYLPDEGYNYEDAISISESFARRMRSQHAYQHQHEWEPGDHQGKKAFISMFPSQYTKKQLDKFDDSGVVKQGETLHFGDPMILIASERERNKKSLVRSRTSFSDKSITWDHHSPGIVTDVVQTAKGPAVVVKAFSEMQAADKLAGRVGDKGIISRIIPDDQMPVGEDGKPMEVLLNPLGLTSRCYDEDTEFLVERGWVFGRDILPEDKFICYHKWTEGLFVLDQLMPFHVADYRGTMLHFKNARLDFCVTPNHRMWAACGYPGAPWQEVTAERIRGAKSWKVPVAGKPIAGRDSDFVLPHIDFHVKATKANKDDIVIAAGDWAELLGWYLSEGNTDEKVHISQSNTARPDECQKITQLLNRLPFAWWYSPKNIQFHITSQRLCEYFKQFGLCDAKYIPEWVFQQTPETRQRFLDSYLAGDGSKEKVDVKKAYNGAGTMSERLAHDLQRLCIYQGISANVSQHASGMWRVGMHSMRHRVVERENWTDVEYAGKIYCPTVATGYIVTRRNGKMLIAGNTNPMQMLEAALGKIAAKTGKPFRMPDFQNQDDLTEFGLAKLKEHGMSPTEVLTLADGRKVKGVPVGNRWFMKLHHMADDKIQGRGLGAYDAEGAPQKGGQDGGKSKRVGMLEQNALLSHGALAVMNEDMRIKGQSSPEYWARYMSGYKPETPKVPFVYNKFVNQLRASGINVIRQGERSHIMAMTNKSVDELVGDRELKNAETVNWKDMAPVKGGLFDQTLTGGHGGTAGGGNMWSFIRLHQPLPNPVMEEPIRHILGLTQKKLQDVIGGKEQLNGKTGAAAIGAALANINLPRALENARADIKSGKKTLRDKAVRRLGYLKTCERLGSHPKDWMMDKVPVLPPAFRPVSVMGAKKLPLVADPNYLYKDLFQLNQMHKELADQLDPDALGDEQAAVYNAFKAVTGLGDPVGIKNQERGVKGILKSVFGSSPKYGVMNRKLLSSTVDMVGRGVIAPDPNLTLDETGIPETAAWDVFGPSVVRRMVRAGVSRQKAVQSVKDQLPAAKQYLQKEMDEGVVVLSRAPTLHRYGTMAFRPKLIKGSAIKMNPLVNKGFGADFDGDQMNFRALTTDEAKQEALQKMLPSVNLFSTANFKADMNVPSQEYVAGLYQASKNSDTETPPAVFATAADAIRAFRSGKLGFDRRVQILES